MEKYNLVLNIVFHVNCACNCILTLTNSILHRMSELFSIQENLAVDFSYTHKSTFHELTKRRYKFVETGKCDVNHEGSCTTTKSNNYQFTDGKWCIDRAGYDEIDEATKHRIAGQAS